MNLRALTLKYFGWCPGVKAASRFIPDRELPRRFSRIYSVFSLGLIVLCFLAALRVNLGPMVSLSELRLEIVTDKMEYSLGETINAKFYIVNDKPHPVKIPFFHNYQFLGKSEADYSDKIITLVFQDPAPDGTTIPIPAQSKYLFGQYTFKPTSTGRFTITVGILGQNEGLGGSLTVIVKPS